MRKILSITLVLAIAVTLGNTPYTLGAQTDDTAADIHIGTTDEEPEEVAHQAVVTLTLPVDTDSELIHEGVLRSDNLIRIRDVMCFDSASTYGTTAREKKALSDKVLYVVHVSSGAYTTDRLIDTLKGYKYVTEVTPNYRMKKDSLTNDTLIDDEWHLGGDNYFTAGSEITKNNTIGYQVEAATPSAVSAPIVAIIDDGVDYTHEDLKDKMWVNPFSKTELPGTYGYDACNGDDDPMPTSAGDYHGTCVAGVIAAETDNSKGIAGVSKDAKIMALKLFDEDSESDGSFAAELAAFEYIYKAQTLGANVVAVNCSYGTEPLSYRVAELDSIVKLIDSITTKIGLKGALVCYSAGNEAVDIRKFPYGTPFQYDKTYTLIAGSSNYYGKLSDFSNYGAGKVDLLAPGDGILTTTRANTYRPETYSAAKRAELCSLYETFDIGTGFYTYGELYSGTSSSLTLSHSSKDFKADTSSGSCQVTFTRTRRGSAYSYMLFYDVTSLGIDPKDDLYVSFDLSLPNSDNALWDCYSKNLKDSQAFDIYTMGKKSYLALNLKALFSDMSSYIGGSMYIDNLSLSVRNPDTEKFGKYDYINGTSFSSPIVAGAVARLASLYPSDNALTRKQRILSKVRVSDSLKDVCTTSGIIDISAFDSSSDDVYVKPLTYKVTKIKLNKTSAKLKVGKTLKLKATITPDYATNKSVTWKVSNKKYASVTKKGVVKAKKKGKGHTVTVTVTAKDGSKKKAKCKVKIK